MGQQAAVYCWHCGETQVCERWVYQQPDSTTADVKFTCPEGHVWWEDIALRTTPDGIALSAHTHLRR
jgi:hypothetical protein